MNSNIPHDSVELTSMILGVVDAFTHYVDKDGLHTLLSTCLEISDFQYGQVFLLDSALMIDLSVSLSRDSSLSQPVRPHSPDYLAGCAMTTLVTQFSLIGEKSMWKTEYAIPLRVKGRAIGVLALFDNNVVSLSREALAILEHICDVAAATIHLTYQINQSRLLISQLQTALDSRVVLEQAKGVLAERMKVDFPTAFQEIRNHARREQRPVHHVAADIIADLSIPSVK
jgi:transcriptional regulator with GAF, ATPase, and Fis domain